MKRVITALSVVLIIFALASACAPAAPVEEAVVEEPVVEEEAVEEEEYLEVSLVEPLPEPPLVVLREAEEVLA